MENIIVIKSSNKIMVSPSPYITELPDNQNVQGVTLIDVTQQHYDHPYSLPKIDNWVLNKLNVLRCSVKRILVGGILVKTILNYKGDKGINEWKFCKDNFKVDQVLPIESEDYLTVKLVCFGCKKCEKSESANLIPILGQVGEEALVGLPIKAKQVVLVRDKLTEAIVEVLILLNKRY